MNETLHSCLVTSSHISIPLQGVRIEACLTGLGSEVTVTQRYTNLETVDVEAVYVFPLEEGAAVCGFTARVGDRLIRGRVEEREKAFEVYDDAMAAGHGAFLLDQERPNIFTVSVGNLRPQQTIEIAITYVTLLTFAGAAVRLLIPTTVSPRYVPAGPPEVGQPDGEHVNPPAQETVPYGLTLTVEIRDTNMTQIESPSHAIRTMPHAHGTIVTLANDQVDPPSPYVDSPSPYVALDRDFVLLMRPEDAHQPVAHVAREADGTLCAMVTFHPQPLSIPSRGNEVFFLLDCSGSMQGDSIAQAQRALALCVRALATHDSFNVVCFGSHFTSLWPAPRPYSQASLEEATQYIQQVQADLGGTEILAPLQHLLQMAPDPERPRQLLILTDGEVSNEADVIDLCARYATTARVFAFGIGAGVSEHLVRGVARASHGAAEFIYPGERIEPKVLRMFGRVHTPAFKHVHIDWGGLEVEQAPAACPAVFGGDSLTVFGRLKGDTTDTVASGRSLNVILHADAHTWEVPMALEQAETGGPIPTLWARHRIRDLEGRHGAPLRGSTQAHRKADRSSAQGASGRSPDLVELGQRYGLLSSATSYVAVEERSVADQTTTQAVLRKVPIAITRGWHGRGSVLPAMAAVRQVDMTLPTPASSPPLEVESQARALAHDVTGQLKTTRRRLAPALGMGNKLAAWRAQPLQSIEERDRATTGDPLFELLMTQQADGSFRLTPILQQWLGQRWPAVKAAAEHHGEARVATAVVVTLLAREAANRADEWGPAVAKAQHWLAHQGRHIAVEALL
jgi:Ca-activated chloride channel family protein